MRRDLAYGQPLTVTVAAAGETGEWVVLWPAGGEVMAADGRGPWRVRDAAAVVAASLKAVAGGVLPIDFDHDIHDPRPGRAGRAVGWIDRLEVTSDGAIRGRVEWTAEGRQALEAKAYRFISPAFARDDHGNVLALVGAGLVNVPAIRQLPAVASQQERISMTPEQLAALRKALGLKDDADAPAVVTAAEALGTAHKALETAAAKVAKAAGQEALTEAVATGVVAKLETAGAAPDPAKFVPKSAYDELATRVGQLETAGRQDKAAQAVDAACKAGKVTPALKDWALEYAGKDLAGFEAWVGKAPVIVAGGRTTGATAAVVASKADGSGLTPEQLEVARSMGIDPKAYKAALDNEEDAA